MMDNARRVEQAVKSMVESLETKQMMPLAKSGYLCCARCCDSASSSAELQHCLSRCQAPAQQAEQIVNQQLKDFQERLQRCAVRCQDEAKESLPPAPQEKDISKAQDVMTSCVSRCAIEYEEKVPRLHQTIQQQLSQIRSA